MIHALRKHWPILLLVALAVIFLGDVWFGGRMLLMRDYLNCEFPGRVLVGNILRSGNLPMWSPDGQCGTPLMASPYNGVLYPPSWIFALASPELAVRLDWTFHFAVAAVGLYLLARYWRLGVGPSLFAAVCFAFSTFLMSWCEFMMGMHSMVWNPLLLLLVSRIIDQTADWISESPGPGDGMKVWPILRKNATCVVGVAVLLALQVLAQPEIIYYFGLIVAVYCIARWWFYGSWKVCGVSMGLLGLGGLLGLALTAPQILQTVEMTRFSIRATEVDAALNITSAHPRHWLTFLLPFLYGRPGYPNAYWAPSVYEFALGTCYVGILPLIALFFCWLRPKREGEDRDARQRRFSVWFFVGVALAGLIMSAGKYTPVYAFLHHWLPGLGHFRFATKFYFYVVFALAMLGGLGFQSLLDSGGKCDEPRRVRVWWVAAGCFGILGFGYVVSLFSNGFLSWLMAHPSMPSVAQVESVMGDYTWAIAFTVVGLGLFAMLAFRRGAVLWVQAGIVTVAFLNLWVISRQVQPTTTSAIYTKRPDALAKRMGHDPRYRFLTNNSGVNQYLYGENRADIFEWAIESGATNQFIWEDMQTLTPGGLPLSRYTQYYGTMMSVPAPGNEKLADMLSMRYVVGGAPWDKVLWANAPRDIQVGERPNALPRASIVSQWRFVKGEEAVMQAIMNAGFDPHHATILEPLAGTPEPASPAVSATDESSGEVRSFVDHRNSVTMEVSNKNRALLVLSDTWYPGWTALVDGVKCPIYQANYLFRGVFLEPGTHQVEFSYKSTYFATGCWIFAMAAAACGALWATSYFSRQSQDAKPAARKLQKAARK